MLYVYVYIYTHIHLLYLPAVIETSLRRHGVHGLGSDNHLRVKMCCVALPTSYTADQECSIALSPILDLGTL